MNLVTFDSGVLIIAGVAIGIFSVVLGGGMFFSIPLMQLL